MQDRKMMSNIPLSKECYTELKYISLKKEIKVQEVAAQILEKAMKKKIEKSVDSLDEVT